MRKFVLLLGLLLLVPALLGIGLGPDIFGEGGSSGPLHPASGTDSQICMGENTDGGTNTFCWRADSATDFGESRTVDLGPIALPSLRTHSKVIRDNDAMPVGTIGVVRFSGTNDYLFSTGFLGLAQSTLDQNVQLRTSQGCDLVGVGLGVTIVSTMDGTDEWCTVRVLTNSATVAANSFISTAGAPAGTWAYCTESIEIGNGSDNSAAGYGTGDPLRDSGDYHVVPLTNCNAGKGGLVLAVEERSASSCTDFNTAQITLWTAESCP